MVHGPWALRRGSPRHPDALSLAGLPAAATRETRMEAEDLRLLIRSKLHDGRLPYNSMPRLWGGRGNGEHCAACEALITKEQLVIEGVTSMHADKKPTPFHVKCFYVWDAERRAIAPPGYSIVAAAIAPSTSTRVSYAVGDAPGT